MENILNKPAFVIHLKQKAPERTEFFTKNILNAGYSNMIIFEAVDASNPEIKEQAMAMFPKIPGFDKELSNGQIGCCLSHFKVLLHIIKNKIDIATIFEDDVHFHPNWSILSKNYYQHTPKNFDIIFIGNQINPQSNKISQEPTFCTHGYIVTLQGAKKLLNALIMWDYYNFKNYQPGWDLIGLYNIDIMIKNIQERILSKKLKPLFNWYCWNGTYHPCQHNKLPLRGNDTRNSGLVFQCDLFETMIHNCTMSDYFINNENVVLKNIINKKINIVWAKYDQEGSTGYDVTMQFTNYLNENDNTTDYTINQIKFKNKYNISTDFTNLKILYFYTVFVSK